MRKISLVLFAAVLAVLASCAKEKSNEGHTCKGCEAQASTRTNAQRPSGKSIAPITPRISNSCVTADNGAPARYSGVELLLPTPNSFRQAESVYVAGDSAESGCIQPGRTSMS